MSAANRTPRSNETPMTEAAEAPKGSLEPRYPASAVPQITGVRLSDGPVMMVNISSSGMLVEGTTRLVPGTQISLDLEGTIEPRRVKATVVRCQVSAIVGGALRYRTALTFAKYLDLPVDEVPQPRAAAASPEEPSRQEAVASPAGTVAPEPGRVYNRW